MLQRYVSYFILQNDWTEKVDQSESPIFVISFYKMIGQECGAIKTHHFPTRNF